MTIKGILHKVHPRVDKGTFSSRKVWLKTETETQYPQVIEIEVSQGKIELFDNIPIGVLVTAEVNLKGRTWTGNDGVEKCFNTLQCWKVTREGATQTSPQANVTSNSGAQPAAQQQGFVEDNEPLPF